MSLAPGIAFVRAERPQDADALRADIVGFAGIFERGPLLVASRIEDLGEFRATFGDLVPIAGATEDQRTREPQLRAHRGFALTPLAVHGFFQNGGGTCILFRLASPKMRASSAYVRDFATGATIGLGASSAGSWSEGLELQIPIVVRKRAAIAKFPFEAPGFSAGDLVRVFGKDGSLAFGRLVPAEAGGLELSPSAATKELRTIESIDPTVHVTLRDARGGVTERFRNLSLLPEGPRAIWRFFAAKEPLGPSLQPEVPPAWLPLDDALALALRLQAPGESALLRSEAPRAWPSGASTVLERPWAAREGRLPEGADGAMVRIVLRGGDDGTGAIDRAAFEAAMAVLASHPAPSIVSIPELMLPFSAQLDPCGELPTDIPIEKPPAAPPPPCAEPSPPPAPPSGSKPRPGVEGEIDNRMPDFAASVPRLQEELLSALGATQEGRERIALIDPLPSLSTRGAIARAHELGTSGNEQPGGSLGAMFYPWVHAIRARSDAGETVFLPACGHIAGIMARTTRERGPSARFANERLEGVAASERALSEQERADLNDGQVSAVASFAGRGVLVYGARSLFAGIGPQKYVPAARVVAFVRRMLRVTGETLVFEPNDPFLWIHVRITLEASLHELFLQGAFAGATPNTSYAVRCDETTNPPDSVALGRVIAEVDIAPSVPLEFLTIRVGFSRDGSEVLDLTGPRRPEVA
ncbi:phage tail sheath subtilisin-like domain-containing protein [Pendulispora brunnea]|uniref:Phage tail sheath subtilisin-like domain-containing protein n=1 Tax=Pendulispora brunnea TaxID=2905690 RepID=A0ABZ2KKX9_9BACT